MNIWMDLEPSPVTQDLTQGRDKVHLRDQQKKLEKYNLCSQWKLLLKEIKKII